ncbi:MAG: hypothetical protein IPM81_10390 [Saprospirales bacterium]|nr:hypothetical protein [Saprospirales bacterium]
MEYFLIKGHFHVVGHSPDGDSLKFEAANAAQWDKIQSEFREPFQANFQKENGSVQLRLQGIDALETHYSPMPVPAPKELGDKTFAGAEKPAPGKYSQPGAFGPAATDKLLELIGVAKANWNGPHTFINSIEVKKGTALETISETGKDRLEGYIAVNDIDQKGRPISWAFAGPAPGPDGSQIPVAQLAKSLKNAVNYRLLAAGLVYPYFFMTLSASLRHILISGVQEAIRKKAHIWSMDKTASGIALQQFSQLTRDTLLYPYLFRRLVTHQFKCMMEGYYDAVKSQKPFTPPKESLFLDRFFEDTNPYIFLIKEKDFVRLGDVVRIDREQFTLQTAPGNIVFLS